jgi:ABC-type oligopeptide transport system substrate-binding subunit
LFIATACGGESEGGAAADRNTTLVRGNGAEATTVDPALADDIHSFNILIDIYEGLVAENAAGEIVPGVARSWQVSDDGLVYQFDLRDDARWSNGDRVVAEDFVRAFRHVANPNTASPYAFLFDAITNFRDAASGDKRADSIGVRVISDSRVEIRLSAPTHHFLALLALPTAFPRHESGDHLISNGAYLIGSKGALDAVDLVKNPHYWNASSVYFETIRYLPIVDEMAEFNMYRSGEIDLTHNIPDAMVQSELATNGSEVRIAPSLAFYYFAFDITEPPFDNAKLRQSLSMAVDRQAIVRLLGRGDTPAYGVVPPGVANYSMASYDWSSHPPAERLDAARRLFEDAGYTHRNPLEITLLYDAGGIHEKIAIAISSMWRQHLGVETVLLKREWQYFLQSRDQRGDWDIMRFAWFGDYNAPSTFLEIFSSSSVQNLTGYSSVAYDALLLEASESKELASASTLMRSAEAMLLDDYPVIPIYFFVSKHMVDESIGGFETNVVDRHPSKYMRRLTPTE